ncbi:hypothetical protein MZO42_08680 [Sphingomonas psychrotolerans]|uniref:Bacterial transcriptional activator domain-containing protein n=1 Tax=Sphingomonas psychrotolerans TaxID=1327635 RepID=A0ABU3N2L0_9SPHN|nr:hypothetical protein [Sphingomonas psychrotolerans]
MLRLSGEVAVDVATLRATLREPAPDADIPDLYGSGLLTGFTLRDAPAFNEWLAIEQAHLRQQVVGRLIEVTEANSLAGTDLNAGAAAALKLLAIDPYNEGGHRALMRIYARQGRAALAIAQYRALSELLRSELQLPPEAETQRLYEQIATSRRDRVVDPKPSPAKAPDRLLPAESVRELSGDLPDPMVTADLTPAAVQPGTQRNRRRHWLIGSLVGALVVLGGGVLTIARSIDDWRSAAPAIARLRPLVGDAMNPDQLALSPDGTQLVFSAARAQGSDLFLVNADGNGSPQQLARDDGDEEAPAWHPDGRSVVFVRYRQGTSWVVLKRLPAGSEEMLATWPGRIQSLTWSPDASYLLASASRGVGRNFRLMRLDHARAHWSALPGGMSGAMRDISPRIAPDGKSVLFIRESGTVGSEIFIRDLASGAERRVAGQAGRVWSAGWSKGGRGVIYGSEEGGESTLWYLQPGSEAPNRRRLATGLHLYWALSLSASGDKLALVTSRTNPTFWKLPDDAVPGTPARRIEMLAGVGDRNPEETILGEIIFVSSRTGEEQLWKRRRDGSLQQLTHGVGRRYELPFASPDGRWIAIAIVRDGASDIYVLDASTGAARRLTRGLAASPTSWSPDGRHLYFRRTGRTYEIFRLEVATGQVSQVTHEGGVAGIPTRDGKEFIYVKDDHVNVWRRSLGADGKLIGPEVRLVGDMAGVADVRRNHLIYLAREQPAGTKALKRYDLQSGRSSVMSRDEAVLGTLTLSASPLGGVIFEKNEQRRDISLIEFE